MLFIIALPFQSWMDSRRPVNSGVRHASRNKIAKPCVVQTGNTNAELDGTIHGRSNGRSAAKSE
jgi:hypothetical protein